MWQRKANSESALNIYVQSILYNEIYFNKSFRKSREKLRQNILILLCINLKLKYLI